MRRLSIPSPTIWVEDMSKKYVSYTIESHNTELIYPYSFALCSHAVFLLVFWSLLFRLFQTKFCLATTFFFSLMFITNLHTLLICAMIIAWMWQHCIQSESQMIFLVFCGRCILPHAQYIFKQKCSACIKNCMGISFKRLATFYTSW